MRVKRLSTLHCYLCDEDILSDEAVRITWGEGILGGFGYFHPKLCNESMLDRLSKSYKIVDGNDREDKASNT